jgi:hypothetical protein
MQFIVDDTDHLPDMPRPILVNQSVPGKLHVDTGAAVFEINSDAQFNLINQVTIDGQDLLEPLAPHEAIQYVPLEEASVVPGGSPDFTPRVTQFTIERYGPYGLLLKGQGSILDSQDRAVLDYTIRMQFVLGSTAVRIDFTVENNHSLIPDDMGQPSNAHNQGAVNSVYLGSLGLCVRLRGESAPRLLTENEVDLPSLSQPLLLHQDSSGTDFWNAYIGSVGWPGQESLAHPRLQSYCNDKGYRITGGGLVVPVTGNQARGWMAVQAGSGAWLQWSMRDFWQNFPKTLEARPDGTLRVDLFPQGERFRHNLRIGEEKTHRLLLSLGRDGFSPANQDAIAKAFNEPLVGVVAPEWIQATGVLPEVPLVQPDRWPLYEDYVRVAFEPSRIFDPATDDTNFGNRTLLETIENYNFYGWQDYGDVPLDYEAFGEHQAGQMNLKYWFLYGLWTQFCRSGDLRWHALARPAAWHMADIDLLHIPDEGPQHWAHGAYFGHSQHDEPGNLNPNRNSNSPSVDLVFGVPGLVLGYYLTGELRFLDSAKESVQGIESMAQFVDFANPQPWDSQIQRAQANLIFAYMEIYRATGDEHWLEQLKQSVQPLLELDSKPWLTNPRAYGAAHPGAFIRMFMMNQVLWTLGRYVDFAMEYGLPEMAEARTALTAYADFVIQHGMQEYPAGSGRAVHPYDIVFDGSDPSYLDVNNWALVMADALAYVYKFSGEVRYLQAAERFYATGTIDPVFEGDPPVYMGTKDLVNALNWGLVYMNQANQAAAIKMREWMMN